MKLTGNDIDLVVNDKIIACGRDLTLESSHEYLPVTIKGGFWREVLPRKQSWTVTSDNIVIWGENENMELIYEKFLNRQKVNIEITSNIAGEKSWVGTAYIQQISETYPLNGMVAANITFRGVDLIYYVILEDGIFTPPFDLTFE